MQIGNEWLPTSWTREGRYWEGSRPWDYDLAELTDAPQERVPESDQHFLRLQDGEGGQVFLMPSSLPNHASLMVQEADGALQAAVLSVGQLDALIAHATALRAWLVSGAPRRPVDPAATASPKRVRLLDV